MTYSEIAARLGCTRWRVRRLVRTMRLDVVKIGSRDHVSLAEIERKLPAIWESVFLAEQVRDLGG